MLQGFSHHIRDNFPELLTNHFLLACSGGLDSVVLVHLCHLLNLKFSIAHCNFKLRGHDSDADADFVRGLANGLGKQFFVTSFDTICYVKENKVSTEMAARELRYAWFNEIMVIAGVDILVTAHHADDDFETFLINLSRGTGIDGLTVILAKTETTMRPMLAFARSEIIAFAQGNNIIWREDASNAETVFIRNKVRHNIVPGFKDLHPTALANFKNSQNRLRQSAQMLENHITEIKSTLFLESNGIVKISIDGILALNPLEGYLYGLFKEYGFTDWEALRSIVLGSSGKQVHSKTHRLVKNRNHLLLDILPTGANKSILINVHDVMVQHPIQLTIEKVAAIGETGLNILYADKSSLKFPLTIRQWIEGDYFYPFGMAGKKKVSKYFKDEKLDIISKDKQWLLCSDEEIVWIIGKRSDNRFSVKDSTKEIMKFTWHI